jgi:hypothetical protein
VDDLGRTPSARVSTSVGRPLRRPAHLARRRARLRQQLHRRLETRARAFDIWTQTGHRTRRAGFEGASTGPDSVEPVGGQFRAWCPGPRAIRSVAAVRTNETNDSLAPPRATAANGERPARRQHQRSGGRWRCRRRRSQRFDPVRPGQRLERNQDEETVWATVRIEAELRPEVDAGGRPRLVRPFETVTENGDAEHQQRRGHCDRHRSGRLFSGARPMGDPQGPASTSATSRAVPPGRLRLGLAQPWMQGVVRDRRLAHRRATPGGALPFRLAIGLHRQRLPPRGSPSMAAAVAAPRR